MSTSAAAELQRWQPRCGNRMPDGLWHATVSRVRAEFAEMPCMRVTRDQARLLFGLDGAAVDWVLQTLIREGYLAMNAAGEFVRRSPAP